MENNINKKIAEMLKSIIDNYNSLNEFAQKADISSAYISKLINLKYKNPPTPKILKKIAEASKGLTTYDELMYICGYSNNKPFGYPFVDNSIAVLTLFVSSNGKLEPYDDLWVDKSLLIPEHQYFGYKSSDESMSPLLGIGDIAIIEQTNTYENEQTYLFSLDNDIFIRKLVDFNTHIELQAINYHFDTIKLTIEEMNKRNFNILGEVVEAKNQSAFKKKGGI